MAAHQALLSLGFSRQAYWSGLPFPSPVHAAAAAAAKSLQSCPILCDPIDGGPPGSRIPWILQARTLEWVAISFSNAWKWKVKVKSLSRPTLSHPMDCSLPGSSVHGIFQARVLEWGAIAFSAQGNYHTKKNLVPEPTIKSHDFWDFLSFQGKYRHPTVRMLLLFGCSVMSDSLWPHGLHHARRPVLHYLSEFAQTHVH